MEWIVSVEGDYVIEADTKEEAEEIAEDLVLGALTENSHMMFEVKPTAKESKNEPDK